MFILLFDHTDESEFFSELCIDFPVHVKKLLGLLAISERFLELLFDFTGHSFEFLALIYFRHLFGQDVDAWLF